MSNITKIMKMIDDIAAMVPDSRAEDYYWEKKILCPYCNEYAMLLKAGGKHGPHYYCISCEAEGPLQEMYQGMLGTMMEKPRGVRQ